MFEKKGLIIVDKVGTDEDRLIEVALDCGGS